MPLCLLFTSNHENYSTMKKIYTGIFLFVLSMSLGLAQEKKSATVKKADAFFARLEFLKAAKAYESALAKGQNTDYVYRKLGDTYYNLFDPKKAVKYYEKIIDKTDDPEVYYRYAQMLKALGKYQESEPWMKKFVSMRPADRRAMAYRANPGYLVKILDKTRKKFVVTEEPSLNTTYADYGAQLTATDKLYFISHRIKSKKHNWDGQPFGDIFEADYTGDVASTIEQIPGEVNTKYHEGPFSLSPDGKTIYFTRNNYDKKYGSDSTGVSRLKIYKATWNGKKWVNVEELPFNSDNFDTAFPAVTPDGKRMYFSSDRPGTFGLSDIWYVDINDDGTFGEPQHLGPEINTEGREDYPFFIDNTLYFSSDGWMGLGGRDVFASKWVDGKFSRARNLGVPVNSGYDDITFSYYPDLKKGFVSSNRDAAQYGDFNIYKVQAVKPVFDVLISVVVLDDKTGKPIPNAAVVLTDNAGNPMGTKTTNADGEVDFLIEGGKDVILEARANDYENNKATVKGTYDEGVDVEIRLKPIEKIITAEQLNIRPIYFDFDKWNIRRDAAFELDNVVEAMKKHPELKIHVVSHTDCRGSVAYNQQLSEKRAKSTVQYIISKGIDASRLTWEGRGETDPKIKCSPCGSCTKEQHQENRRSDFIIVNENQEQSGQPAEE